MPAKKKIPTAGETLVESIVAEMADAGVEPDSKETALLETARQLVDRLDALERTIATDGEILTSSTGVVKVHPAVAEHRQQAVSLTKVLGGIVIADSTAGKNPTKQRAAAQRWANRDRKLATIEANATEAS